MDGGQDTGTLRETDTESFSWAALSQPSLHSQMVCQQAGTMVHALPHKIKKPFDKKICFILNDVYLCVFYYVWMSTNAHGGEQRASDALEMELQVVLSYLIWIEYRHQSWALCRSSTCSLPVGSLSSPHFDLFYTEWRRIENRTKKITDKNKS